MAATVSLRSLNHMNNNATKISSPILCFVDSLVPSKRHCMDLKLFVLEIES